jgi:hypothetical protein
VDGDPRTTRDPSGRVTIVETDDRGSPFPIIVSQPVNVRGIAAFSELVRIPMERARKGHLLLSALVRTNGLFLAQFVFVEINVVGYVASAPQVLMRTALGANTNLVTFSWDEPDTYGSLGIEARQNVDGQPSGDTAGIDDLNFSVAGTYWR